MLTFLEGKYTAEKDSHQWILHEWHLLTGRKDPKTKERLPDKRVSKDTYHPSLQQVCRKIIDNEAGKCESVEDLLNILEIQVHFFTAVADKEYVKVKDDN